jgi:hypothetical protein
MPTHPVQLQVRKGALHRRQVMKALRCIPLAAQVISTDGANLHPEPHQHLGSTQIQDQYRQLRLPQGAVPMSRLYPPVGAA